MKIIGTFILSKLHFGISLSRFLYGFYLEKKCILLYVVGRDQIRDHSQVGKFQSFCFSRNFSFFSVWTAGKLLNLFELQYCAVLNRSCPTLCNPMHCSPPDSLSMGILQAKILEWVAMPSSSESSPPRDQTHVSCIAGRFFTIWTTMEASDVICSVSNQYLSTKITCYWEDKIKLVPGSYLKVKNKRRDGGGKEDKKQARKYNMKLLVGHSPLSP